MPRPKISLASQIAELEVSGPKDFDPEEEQRYELESGSDAGESVDETAGTEHYEKVGKSKLRKPQEVALGPKYVGARVSREVVFEGEDSLEEEEEEDDSEAEQFESASDSEEEYGEGPFAELDEVDVGEGVGLDDKDGEIDSDAAFGESDDEKFKSFAFRGSGKPRDASGKKQRPTAADFMSESEEENLQNGNSEQEETDEDVLDVDAQHSEDSEDEDVDMNGGAPLDDEEDEDSNESQSDQGSVSSVEDDSQDDSEDESDEDEEDASRRDELRKIMGEEQQTVAAMSQALKADALKGNAVKAQRKGFDQLLHTRMDLQKALIATNSLAATEDAQPAELDSAAYEAAESAALKLWTTLDTLRKTLSKSSSKKRKRSEIDSGTPSSELWDRMQAHELAMLDTRQTTLDKWSSKVRSIDAQPVIRKLGPATTHQQPLSTLLQDQLATSSEHLIARTQIPRSCAPVQRDAKIASHPAIFDDGPFYQLLLKELVDQRRVKSSTGGSGEVSGGVMGWTAVKEVKARKVVDTKASKGRKMRYNVHEKLQNFMAREERGTWEDDARTRFFGSLLGLKMTLAEDDAADTDEEEKELEHEEEGLKLFRS